MKAMTRAVLLEAVASCEMVVDDGCLCTLCCTIRRARDAMRLALEEEPCPVGFDREVRDEAR